jgi:CHAT domain-containing protein
MLLDGLSAQLARLDELVVVPDGSLHEVAWEALPTASGAYWVEEGPLLRVVDHERALLEAPVADRGLDSTTVSAIFGDPDFGPGTPTRDRCAALPEIRFSRLPGTRDEVDELRAELPDARVYLGADATEAALRRVAPRAAILHLATHGFFLSADCDRSGTTAPGTGDTRGIGGLAVRRDPDSRVVAPPLLRAGLVLAGANRRGPDTDAEEDGILLADEILGLDLPAGAWVVLSACDTGVGQAQVGEGVLGLRRAFAIAGARTLVMSLWSVEDESTRIWMRELYRARFGEGASTAQAARLASRRVLASRRARGQSVHPFWWAAFVATGSD